nr:hypothetical protein HMPREF0276_0033 [Corynebacterium accolens ATCC 49725]
MHGVAKNFLMVALSDGSRRAILRILGYLLMQVGNLHTNHRIPSMAVPDCFDKAYNPDPTHEQLNRLDEADPGANRMVSPVVFENHIGFTADKIDGCLTSR